MFSEGEDANVEPVEIGNNLADHIKAAAQTGNFGGMTIDPEVSTTVAVGRLKSITKH